ncbi:hypothetical protein BCE02nite_11090 [Brevibacillus centrosporus]|nr:hypothetical protein BCE02nite_11090 [Brevibacillus centrosporus]
MLFVVHECEQVCYHEGESFQIGGDASRVAPQSLSFSHLSYFGASRTHSKDVGMLSLCLQPFLSKVARDL